MSNNFKEKYHKSLQSPKWQKKRLKIMERDEFRCQFCGDDGSQLSVHHITYENMPSHQPWLTPDEDLITVCVDCHKTEHNGTERIKQKAGHYLLNCGETVSNTVWLLALITISTHDYKGMVVGRVGKGKALNIFNCVAKRLGFNVCDIEDWG